MLRLALLLCSVISLFTGELHADGSFADGSFADGSFADGWSSQVLRRYQVTNVRQGVAVDDQYLYTISNREIVKLRKDTGEEILRWRDQPGGPFIHLNAAVVRDGRLYAAHSNFPALPMRSSIEIWDADTLRPVERHDFGETDGSLTWLDRRGGHWYAAFVHYGKSGGVPGRGPEKSRIVQLDSQWRPLREWTFPPDLIRRFAGYSSSCGAFGPGGYLYVTGHDEKELYVLEFPQEGSVMKWIATIPVAFSGQGFAWDPSSDDVAYGISRKSQEIIAVQVRSPEK